jgi:protein arginine kinase activator
MSYEDFQRTGKLGCDQCFDTFRDQLEPVLKRVHGNVEHNGKIPSSVSASIKASREIIKLKEQLNKAIQGEDYEKAAVIRDRIKALEVGGK